MGSADEKDGYQYPPVLIQWDAREWGVIRGALASDMDAAIKLWYVSTTENERAIAEIAFRSSWNLALQIDKAVRQAYIDKGEISDPAALPG